MRACWEAALPLPEPPATTVAPPIRIAATNARSVSSRVRAARRGHGRGVGASRATAVAIHRRFCGARRRRVGRRRSRRPDGWTLFPSWRADRGSGRRYALGLGSASGLGLGLGGGLGRGSAAGAWQPGGGLGLGPRRRLGLGLGLGDGLGPSRRRSRCVPDVVSNPGRGSVEMTAPTGTIGSKASVRTPM
jgi:hypothetical protein